MGEVDLAVARVVSDDARWSMLSERSAGGSDMTSSEAKKRIMLCAFAMFVGAIAACSSDISSDPVVAAMIGREYRIVGDVDAYGIKADRRDTKVSFVELIPLGIGGPEVVFRQRLPKGQTFRIHAARHQFKPFENGIEYVIELQDSELPSDIEVRLALTRGNGSGDADLNPRLYQRVVNDE
jgi:hypothetical protein